MIEKICEQSTFFDPPNIPGEPNLHSKNQFPIQIIDYEASSLEMDSYPIEVGVCIWRDSDSNPQLWSSLIAPTAEWLDRDSWDPASQNVHGITRDVLMEAPSALLVAQHLNELLDQATPVWCDGGHYDTHWNKELFTAACIRPRFHIGDFWLPFRLARKECNQLANWLAQNAPQHRAGSDCLRLMSGLAAVKYPEANWLRGDLDES